MPKFIEQFAKEQSLSDLPSIEVKDYATLVMELCDIPQVPKISSGLYKFDQLTEGFQGGELIVLSAPTKHGKTTFALNLSWKYAMQNIGVLWFTYEMSWQEITKKLMGMDQEYAETGKPSIMPIVLPIDHFRRAGDLQLMWMRELIEKNRHMISFVIIDHLHFLVPLQDFKQNASFIIGGIVRQLKKIAVELNIPIMLIAHTKKTETAEAPDINSIRDSSFIAQESDFTILMWKIRRDKARKSTDDEEMQEDIFTDKVMIAVEANRRTGKTGRVKMKFSDGQLREMTPLELAQDEVERREKRQKFKY